MNPSSKKYWVVIIVLLVAMGGMFLWKTIAEKKLRQEQTAQRQQWAEVTRQTITENARQFLRLAAIPLVWAIRSEMLKENYEQINEFLIEFVKESHIKMILVATVDGTVVVATDKKLEGAAFSSLYPGGFLEKNETTVADDASGNIIIASPVMAFNRKLGIFFMVYEPERIAIATEQ
ncbi:MAG: hypothetical protein JXI33_02315 [Candidatus Aminicenantes bacterium]|nr:hypothetical protein [Candidatus Aminicenantes bacterium]